MVLRSLCWCGNVWLSAAARVDKHTNIFWNQTTVYFSLFFVCSIFLCPTCIWPVPISNFQSQQKWQLIQVDFQISGFIFCTCFNGLLLHTKWYIKWALCTVHCIGSWKTDKKNVDTIFQLKHLKFTWSTVVWVSMQKRSASRWRRVSPLLLIQMPFGLLTRERETLYFDRHLFGTSVLKENKQQLPWGSFFRDRSYFIQVLVTIDYHAISQLTILIYISINFLLLLSLELVLIYLPSFCWVK